MHRRAVLSAVVGLSTVTAGCLGSCQGVALAIELNPPAARNTREVLNFDEMDLSQEEQEVLNEATQERVVDCTGRNMRPGLQKLVGLVADHTGISEFDLYYSDGRAETPARFQRERYHVVIIYDTAESAGGPLDA